jgi:hypothetical protein
MGTVLMGLSSDLMAFDFTETFTGPFEVANKVGCSVCVVLGGRLGRLGGRQGAAADATAGAGTARRLRLRLRVPCLCPPSALAADRRPCSPARPRPQVSEMLMLRMGIDVCCVSDEDRSRAERLRLAEEAQQ